MENCKNMLVVSWRKKNNDWDKKYSVLVKEVTKKKIDLEETLIIML